MQQRANKRANGVACSNGVAPSWRGVSISEKKKAAAAWRSGGSNIMRKA